MNKFSPQSLQEREGCQKKLRVDYYCEQWEGGSERYELWEAEGTRHEHSFEISKGPKYSLIQAVNEHFKSGGSPYGRLAAKGGQKTEKRVTKEETSERPCGQLNRVRESDGERFPHLMEVSP